MAAAFVLRSENSLFVPSWVDESRLDISGVDVLAASWALFSPAFGASRCWAPRVWGANWRSNQLEGLIFSFLACIEFVWGLAKVAICRYLTTLLLSRSSKIVFWGAFWQKDGDADSMAGSCWLLMDINPLGGNWSAYASKKSSSSFRSWSLCRGLTSWRKSSSSSFDPSTRLKKIQGELFNCGCNSFRTLLAGSRSTIFPWCCHSTSAIVWLGEFEKMHTCTPLLPPYHGCPSSCMHWLPTVNCAHWLGTDCANSSSSPSLGTRWPLLRPSLSAPIWTMSHMSISISTSLTWIGLSLAYNVGGLDMRV